MEWLVLGLFAGALLLCIALGASILWALLFGLLLFMLYGRRRGRGWRELLATALAGVGAVRQILTTFFLIGIMTALWRAAGTIAVIVSWPAGLIRPSVFLLMSFLLNCGVSLLTGTSFGTAATMGVICAAMGAAMGVDPRLTGGAVLSGVFFGDRCSPMSTSALLVAALTHTDIYDNLRRMMRSALVPFIVSCGVYAGLGLAFRGAGEAADLRALFGRAFVLHWAAALPAAAILLLAALRVKVRLAMAVSIAVSAAVCLRLQGIAPPELLRMAFLGFRPADEQVAAMVGGGGVASMLKVAGIVCLSSSYSGLFALTGLLDGARRLVDRLADRTTPFAATLATAVAAGLVACNQTLTILLTHQLCAHRNPDEAAFACDLEDTAVVVAPLVPWSIAGATPLAAIGAPLSALPAACYLYLIPLWKLAVGIIPAPAAYILHRKQPHRQERRGYDGKSEQQDRRGGAAGGRADAEP